MSRDLRKMFNSKARIKIAKPDASASVLFGDTVIPEIEFNGGIHDLKGDVMIVADLVRLKSGATIAIGKNNLIILAKKIESAGGSIVAFPPKSDRDFPKPAQSGKRPGQRGDNGDPGLAAGSVNIRADEIVLDGNKPLLIDVSGQNGQDGGNGAIGKQGKEGRRGNDSITGFMKRRVNGDGRGFEPYCKKGATNGRPGGKGGRGGRAGNGGEGGAAGNISVRIGKGDVRKLVKAVAVGGLGGKAGKRGERGPGGIGGSGGKNNRPCSGSTSKGPNGPKGDLGKPGVDRRKQRAAPGKIAL